MHPPGHPGPESAHVVRVVPVPQVGIITVVFAGKIHGLILHWGRQGSIPCPGQEQCPPSDHRLRSTYKGYVPGRIWDRSRQLWTPGVIELTEAIEEVLRGRNLVGEEWSLRRAPGKGRSRSVLGEYVQTRNEPSLLLGFPVLPPLQRMYHRLDLVLGAENPLPTQLILPESPAVGPLGSGAMAPLEVSKPTREQLETLRDMAGRRSPPNPKPTELYPRPSANGAPHK
jgi:hypothetical protein